MTRLIQPIFSFFASLLLWFYISTVTVIASTVIIIVSLLLLPFDRKRRAAHRLIIYLWAYPIIKGNPFWKLSLEGRENIQAGRHYVIVSNHSSLADIICLYALNLQFKWIAKESLFQIPFLGWSMFFAKYISLKRGAPSSIRDSYDKAREWLKQNMSVLIFPEGTRSLDGRLGEFKNGAFKLAIETQVPILPVILQGSDKIIPKGKSAFSSRCEAKLKILPVIETQHLREDDFASIKTRVHEQIKAGMQN